LGAGVFGENSIRKSKIKMKKAKMVRFFASPSTMLRASIDYFGVKRRRVGNG
jgi:hypothetical protein